MNQKKVQDTGESPFLKQTLAAMELLKGGKFSDAYEIFSETLKMDYNNSVAETGLKCCKYWLPRISTIESNPNPYMRGKLYYDEWKKFEKFLLSQKNIQMKIVSSIMFYVFNTALQYLKKDIQDNNIIDIPTLFLIGLSYKKIGDFDNALRYFERVIKNDRYNAVAFSQLADCYALIDEEKKAKVLFREAFFIDPSSIDIETLDSNMIQTLKHEILESKLPADELAYWIPVYGRILGIFNVRRDLLAVELGKIKQEIFHMEQELAKGDGIDQRIKARLINFYLWLYDYYIVKKPDDDMVPELENKIKNLSITVYNILKNNMMQE